MIISYTYKVSNGKSVVDYWVKEYSEEKFCNGSFHNKWHVMYTAR